MKMFRISKFLQALSIGISICVVFFISGCANIIYSHYPRDFSTTPMPDPAFATWYDNDYAMMITFYTKYVQNYALMSQVLAKANSQYEVASTLANQINSVQGSDSQALKNSSALVDTITSTKPTSEKIDRGSNNSQWVEQKAREYEQQAQINFNYALTYAKTICRRHAKDFEKRNDRSGHPYYWGPAYDLPMPVQENMNRIREAACIIRGMSGRRNLAAITAEISSWFTGSEE